MILLEFGRTVDPAYEPIDGGCRSLLLSNFELLIQLKHVTDLEEEISKILNGYQGSEGNYIEVDVTMCKGIG